MKRSRRLLEICFFGLPPSACPRFCICLLVCGSQTCWNHLINYKFCNQDNHHILLPSSALASTSTLVELRLLYSQLIQPPTHPPSHPPTHPAGLVISDLFQRQLYLVSWSFCKSKICNHSNFHETNFDAIDFKILMKLILMKLVLLKSILMKLIFMKLIL